MFTTVRGIPFCLLEMVLLFGLYVRNIKLVNNVVLITTSEEVVVSMRNSLICWIAIVLVNLGVYLLKPMNNPLWRVYYLLMTILTYKVVSTGSCLVAIVFKAFHISATLFVFSIRLTKTLFSDDCHIVLSIQLFVLKRIPPSKGIKHAVDKQKFR